MAEDTPTISDHLDTDTFVTLYSGTAPTGTGVAQYPRPSADEVGR